jgi:transposase
MPKIKFTRREPTEDWQQLQLLFTSPFQAEYELIRPVVLFGQTISERAQQTGKNSTTIRRRITSFTKEGSPNFFADQLPSQPATSSPSVVTPNLTIEVETEKEQAETSQVAVACATAYSYRLPSEISQFILALVAQYPHFRPNEIAHICEVKFERRPDARTIQRVLAQHSLTGLVTPRFPPFAEIASSEERRLAVIRLYSEGWNIKSIAGYLLTSRKNVHHILKRWWNEGVAGLTDKSHARRQLRKVTLNAIAKVQELQTNPHLSRLRMQAALKQVGIEVSASTCAKLMRRNRELWDYLPKSAKTKQTPQKAAPAKKEMPLPHSVDINTGR